jgi:hypothetical protein
VRTVRGALRRLRVDWEAGLGRLPFFTQRTAVLLLGVLVATLAMLGGVVALVGWPGAGGPTHLVPGERAGRSPASRPAPDDGPAPGAGAAGADRSGADAGGATAAPPSPAPDARSAPAGGSGAGRPAGGAAPGGAATGAQGSGGAAGAGAGGPPAAPPTTSPPATTPGLLDPVEELLGPAVSTLVP